MLWPHTMCLHLKWKHRFDNGNVHFWIYLNSSVYVNQDLTFVGCTENIQPIRIRTRAPPAPTNFLLCSQVSTSMNTAIAPITRIYNKNVTTRFSVTKHFMLNMVYSLRDSYLEHCWQKTWITRPKVYRCDSILLRLSELEYYNSCINYNYCSSF